jgi:hypothetical protein
MINNTQYLDLRILLNKLGNSFTGLRKADDHWASIREIFLDKVNTFPRSELEEDQNYIYDAGGNQVTVSKENWMQIQTLMSNLNLVDDNNNRRLALHDNLKLKTNALFQSYLLNQTITTSLLKIIKGKTHIYLTEIFCEEYANCLYKNKCELPGEVYFIDICKRIGENLFSLVFDSITRQLPGNKYSDIKEFHSLLPYFTTIIEQHFYLDNNFIDLDKVNPINRNRLITLFVQTFKFQDFRYLFAKKDLLIFIGAVNLYVIQLLTKIILQDVKNNFNKKAYNFLFSCFFKEEPFSENHKNLNQNTYYIAIRQQVHQKLTEFYLTLGQEILNILEDKVISISSSMTHKNIREPFTVRLIEESFISTLPCDLPNVVMGGEKLAYNLHHQEITTMHISYKRKHESKVNNNHYLSGNLRKPDILNQSAESNKFTINYAFTYEFFYLLNETKEFFTVLKETELLSNNDSVDSVKLNFSLNYIGVNLNSYLNFISELFDINFTELYLIDNVSLKSLILEIVDYALDFNNNKKFELDYTKYKDALTLYYHFYKKIINNIYSKKLTLNEIFYELSIMSNFGYFMYSWFTDGRGRLYTKSMLTLQNMPILRCLISFYKATNIEEYARYIYLDKNQQKLPYAYIKDDLINSVNAIYRKKLTEYSITNYKEVTFMAYCKQLPIGNRFLGYALLLDYLKFQQNPEKHRFSHSISWDATNSGLQMMAILFKSQNLAQYCNLVDGSKDCYQVCEDTLKGQIASIRVFIKWLLHKFNIKSVPTNINKIDFEDSLKSHLTIEFLNTVKIPHADVFPKLSKVELILKYCLFYNTLQLDIDDCVRNTIIKRKTLKLLCMTTPYGSTRVGTSNQILDIVEYTYLNKGMWLDAKVLSVVSASMNIIYDLFMHWFSKTLPEALILRNGTKEYCNPKNQWEIFKIESPYFNFDMYPIKNYETRYNIRAPRNSKSRRVVLRYPTNHLDWVKLQTSFPANIIHFMDANIISILAEKISKYNQSAPRLHYYTNHDCFSVTPLHSIFIKQLLKESYTQLYQMDLLNNLKACLVFYQYIQNILEFQEKLNEEDLCKNLNFLK